MLQNRNVFFLHSISVYHPAVSFPMFYLFGYHVHKFWRSSSLVFLFIFHFILWSLLVAFAVSRPNIINGGHHQRLMASWHMAFVQPFLDKQVEAGNPDVDEKLSCFCIYAPWLWHRGRKEYAGKHYLIHNSSTIHQPAHGTHIGPA